jgi:hypothetical protein
VVENYPQVQIYFRFFGERFDPDEITRRLGIEPTIQFRPGDSITKDGRGRRRHFGWMVKLGPRDTLDIDDMLRELRERVIVSAVTVKKLCDDLGVDLVIVCGVSGESADTMPEMLFPTDFLKWVVELGAELSIDVIA